MHELLRLAGRKSGAEDSSLAVVSSDPATPFAVLLLGVCFLLDIENVLQRS